VRSSYHCPPASHSFRLNRATFLFADPLMNTDEPEYDGPSKSELKRRSDDLQALGEALIDLPDVEFDALPLPESLRDAVLLARRITAHGGLYRQKQYIGKLMRKIDAEPIRAAIAARRDQTRLDALRFKRVEAWRDRLISEGPEAIAVLRTENATVTFNVAELTSLIKRARQERLDGAAPKAARELFRVLRDALAVAAGPAD
jgi:ribosome-associated protein